MIDAPPDRCPECGRLVVEVWVRNRKSAKDDVFLALVHEGDKAKDPPCFVRVEIVEIAELNPHGPVH